MTPSHEAHMRSVQVITVALLLIAICAAMGLLLYWVAPRPGRLHAQQATDLHRPLQPMAAAEAIHAASSAVPRAAVSGRAGVGGA